MDLLILCGVSLILHATGVVALPLWSIILMAIPLGFTIITGLVLLHIKILKKSPKEKSPRGTTPCGTTPQNYVEYRRVCENCGIEVSSGAIECPYCGYSE